MHGESSSKTVLTIMYGALVLRKKKIRNETGKNSCYHPCIYKEGLENSLVTNPVFLMLVEVHAVNRAVKTGIAYYWPIKADCSSATNIFCLFFFLLLLNWKMGLLFILSMWVHFGTFRWWLL